MGGKHKGASLTGPGSRGTFHTLQTIWKAKSIVYTLTQSNELFLNNSAGPPPTPPPRPVPVALGTDFNVKQVVPLQPFYIHRP